MDRQLKERITGAALLVLAAVIFVPWLLDGRVTPNEFEKSITIPPPGGGASNLRTIVLDADRNATAPVTAAPTPARVPAPDLEPAAAPEPVDTTPAASAQVVVADPAPERQSAPAAPVPVEAAPSAPAPKTAPVVASKSEPPPVATAPAPARTAMLDPTTGWAVQVGSFASQANANKLADQLVTLDYKAFVSRKRLNGRVMYRVRVGPRATRDEALKLAERLRTDRQPVRVVEHPG